MNKNNTYNGSSGGTAGSAFKRNGSEFKKKTGNNQNSSGNSQNANRKHPDYCWGLNGKSNFCRFADKCRFVNKCSYCDSPQHGITKCPKLMKDKIEENMGANKQ